jgi:hypothetical protein
MNVVLGSVKPSRGRLCVQVYCPNPFLPSLITWLVYGENHPLPPHLAWPWLAYLNPAGAIIPQFPESLSRRPVAV